jgi:predicted TIM-barrel fold metal-dependent hydrolase
MPDPLSQSPSQEAPHIWGSFFLDTARPFLYIQPIPKRVLINLIDEMAELVLECPDRFVAVIAHLPMSNMDAALKEADRAINALKVQRCLCKQSGEW